VLNTKQVQMLDCTDGPGEPFGPDSGSSSSSGSADAAETTRIADRLWWWIAINGASCAASSLPLPATLEVFPTPEQLLGFGTREEQLSAQDLLLTAPISKVRRFLNRTIRERVKKGEVVVIQPSHPEPPTQGPTIWLLRPPDCSSHN